MPRLPIIPSIIVLIAVGIMIRLGFWQLDRKDQKEALLARYANAQKMSSDVAWPRDADAVEGSLYRHSRIHCDRVTAIVPMAGSNSKGQSGIGHLANCDLDGGGSARVLLGWSQDPALREWTGGEVSGFIAPGGDAGPRLIADPPLAGLEANAVPDPSNIPNNHLAYAVQWFLFALVALVIYALAVRKRLAGRGGQG